MIDSDKAIYKALGEIEGSLKGIQGANLIHEADGNALILQAASAVGDLVKLMASRGDSPTGRPYPPESERAEGRLFTWVKLAQICVAAIARHRIDHAPKEGE